jgi:hypothetical protein
MSLNTKEYVRTFEGDGIFNGEELLLKKQLEPNFAYPNDIKDQKYHERVMKMEKMDYRKERPKSMLVNDYYISNLKDADDMQGGFAWAPLIAAVAPSLISSFLGALNQQGNGMLNKKLKSYGKEIKNTKDPRSLFLKIKKMVMAIVDDLFPNMTPDMKNQLKLKMADQFIPKSMDKLITKSKPSKHDKMIEQRENFNDIETSIYILVKWVLNKIVENNEDRKRLLSKLPSVIKSNSEIKQYKNMKSLMKGGANFWSILKNIGKSVLKALIPVANTSAHIASDVLLNKLGQSENETIKSIANNPNIRNLANEGIDYGTKKISEKIGNGAIRPPQGGKKRFVKGSPEAKQYMAQLRSKKGKGMANPNSVSDFSDVTIRQPIITGRVGSKKKKMGGNPDYTIQWL